MQRPKTKSPRRGRASRNWSGRRDLNPRLRPWQGRTLPLSYSRPPLHSTAAAYWVTIQSSHGSSCPSPRYCRQAATQHFGRNSSTKRYLTLPCLDGLDGRQPTLCGQVESYSLPRIDSCGLILQGAPGVLARPPLDRTGETPAVPRRVGVGVSG